MSLRLLFTYLFLLSFPHLTIFESVQLYSCYSNGSDPEFCHPLETSLSFGSSIIATSTCGLVTESMYATRNSPSEVNCCLVCNETAHPPSFLTDFMVYPPTWWQSENAIYTPRTVNLTLSVGRLAEVTLISLTFVSYKPDSLYIERSIDFGVSYEPYHYFSSQCTAKYGLDSDATILVDGQVTCEDISSTSRPGILIFFPSRDRPTDVNTTFQDSNELASFTVATNLRVVLDGHRIYPNRTLNSDMAYYYAISEFSVNGRCICNGHASICDTYTFACQCEHNTTGVNCEDCEEFHFDLTWRRATPSEPFACRRCECNNHSSSCYFSPSAYLSSGNTTGGVCINCTDNTVGQHCDMCALGYYVDSNKQLSDRDVCKACECNSAGENNSGNCNQTTGQCYCKDNVVGRNCSECSYGYYNLSAANPEGCTACGCNTFGSLNSSQCDAISGQCMCRKNTQGLTCNECKPGFYNILSGTYDGCVECGCNVGSSSSSICNETGHCQCRDGVAGRICDQVMDGYFIPQADYMTYEAESGSGNFTLISKSSGINVEFTGAGYARLTSGSILTLSQFLRVPVSGTYNFTIRYTLTTSNAPISLNIVLHPGSYTQSSPQNAQSCSQQVISLTSFPLENIEIGISMIAEYNGVCLNSQISYKIYLEPTSANMTFAFVDIDSFVVIAASPLSALDVFTSNTASISSYIQNCVELRKSILNWASVNYSFCDPITLSAAAELYTSLPPCQCNLNGSTNKSCGINGQCYCYMGVGSDKNCSICLPGYHSLIPGVGCSKCNCSTEGSTSDVCNVSNGACFCLANVIGFNCDTCAINAYNFTPGVGCVSCDCDVMGSSDFQCTTDGVCQCKPGVTGVKCERCKIGYFGMNDSGCSICDCDSRGVKIILTCDRMTGNCKCKANVEGRRCDQCTSGHINLQLANPYGCQPCYCSSRGDMCSEARGFIQGEQRTNFTDGDVFVNEGWRTLDSVQAHGAYSVYSQPYSPMGTGIAIGVNYIQAPAKFLGNKLSSYSQILIMRFSLDPTLTQLPELTCPPYNILLSGGGMTIGICNSSLLSHIPVNNDIITIRILFHESYKWRRHDNNDYVTTQEFQYILSDLDSLLLRVSFTSSNTIIHEVILPVALRSSQGPPVNWVENCSCNANYSSLSCQNCAGGYFRQNNDTCHACQCFGDNVRCDPITGVCTSCPPYSTGQFCENCLDGFYGDPELDINCIPCSCPGVGGNRSFSDTCTLISSAYLTPNMSNMVCDCRVGHRGIRCELCDDNYFGDPGGIFGVVKGCALCDCNGNINLNASGNCHNTTGECLKCLYNTTGVKCEQCEDGFFGDAIFAKNCSPCGCDLQGSSYASTCNLVSGKCNCRNNVLGRRCDYCPMGYFGISNGTGCTECACNTNGSVTINSCHNVTGKCQCKVGVTNDKCDQCYEGYYNFTSTGCTPCNCFKGGSIGINCSETGQCICKDGVFSDKCDTCGENFYDVTSGCLSCPACYVELQDKVNELRRNISVVNTTLTAYESSVPPRRFIDRLNQAIDKVVELHTTLSILQNKKEQLLMLITELNQTAMYLTEFIREGKELDKLEGQATQITANADGILILINDTESDVLMLHTFIENILRPNETQVLNYTNQLNETLIQLRADVMELNNIAALHRRQVDTIESAVSNSSNLSSLASQSVTDANQFVTKVLSRKINRLLREVISLKYYTLLLKYEAIEILLKAKSKLAESKDLLRDSKQKNSNSNTSLSYQNRTLIQLESDISSLVYANQQLNKTFILLISEVAEFASNLSAIYSNIAILQSNNTELYTTANSSYRYASGLVNKSNETIQSLENRLAILTDFDNRTQKVASKANASLIKVEEIRENSTRVLNNSIKILSNFSATLEKSVAALNLTIRAGSIASDTTLNLSQSNTLLNKYLNDTKSNITRFNQSLTHINNLVSLAYNIQNNQFTMLEQTANKTLNDSLQKAQDFEFYSNLSLAKANMILKNIYKIIASLPRSAVNISEAREQANALRDALEKAKIQEVYDSLLMRYSQQMKQKQDFADKIKKLKKEFASLKDFEKSLPKTCSPVRSLD